MVQKHRYDHGLNGAVAAVIRGERAMADLTIQQLADRAGVNSQTLRRYLAMERAFDIETLDDVAGALGLTAATVMARAQERLVAQSKELAAEQGAYLAVRGNRALGKALDQSTSGDPAPPQDSQRIDSKKRRRA